MKRKSILAVALLNIVIAALFQIVYWSTLYVKIDAFVFQFIVIPLVIMIINIALELKFKIGFYQYLLCEFLGVFFSVITMVVMSLIKHVELPPGEKILHADVLLIILISIVQIFILLFLNLLVYGGYRFYTKK
ncbi:hypothetical protein [Ureibacillus sinduriensis]|uniref:Uncharacterized protein n=1 Tax=Ureibacillus sinduriensis BLB-1 = JCM 15800 TaxID=1384057 RepID=A0A0A3IMW0_9BACL|nr:hypothetical protein [Ureibacillus sinduriensis]KGR76177.1 hypothetical protein CD33_08415 [Ureibacillus sinduriensis BLB-1 = JCM 15800]